MKKITIALFVFVLLISFSSCSGNTQNNYSSQTLVSSQKLDDAKSEILSEQLNKYEDSLGEANVEYIAEIKNTGTVTVALKNGSLDLEDTKGSIINSVSMVSFYPSTINPGESAYVSESALDMGQSVNLNDVGKAVLHYKVESTEPIEKPNVEITEFTPQIKYERTSFVGKIQNKSGKSYKDIEIVSPIRDASGKLKTIAFSMIEELNANESKGFESNIVVGNSQEDFSKSVIKPYAYID